MRPATLPIPTPLYPEKNPCGPSKRPLIARFIGIFSLLSVFFCFFLQTAWAERIFFAGYKGGFYIRSEEEGGMELRLGGAFQSDYRHYEDSSRADNGFDIRRARMVFNGQLTQWFRFGLEYEFEGNETRNLVDAYGELVYNGLHALRFGQFKEPFSFEWQTRDKGTYFAERSIGYSLTPKRDIGAMLHGSFYHDAVNYAVGLFNGDGVDGSSGGDRDDPEFAARVAVRPFKPFSTGWLDNFQIGVSATYGKISLSNVDLEVKSTGMFGTDRNLYTLKQNTKFGVLQDAEDRMRAGLEAAWAWNAFAAMGEYIHLQYTDLKPSGGSVRDAEFSSAYISLLYSLTGEPFIISEGVMKPFYPQDFFNPSEGRWGGFVVGLRGEHFEGDEDWVMPDAFVSVDEADAVSATLNWIPYPMLRMILDYTYTDFSDPIRVRVDPDGSVDYVNKESVLTVRLSMDF